MSRKSKFSDAEIIGFIKKLEGGAKATELARRIGVSKETLSRWRAKFGGMSVSEAQDKRPCWLLPRFARTRRLPRCCHAALRYS
jgi:transposase-like protein